MNPWCLNTPLPLSLSLNIHNPVLIGSYPEQNPLVFPDSPRTDPVALDGGSGELGSSFFRPKV